MSYSSCFFFQIPFIQHGETIISLLNTINIKISKRTGFSTNYFFSPVKFLTENAKNHVIKKKSIHYTCDLRFLMLANVTVRKKPNCKCQKLCSFSHIFSFSFMYSICQWPFGILYKNLTIFFCLNKDTKIKLTFKSNNKSQI